MLKKTRSFWLFALKTFRDDSNKVVRGNNSRADKMFQSLNSLINAIQA